MGTIILAFLLKTALPNNNPPIAHLVSELPLGHRGASNLAFSRDGRMLSVFHDARLTFWETASRKVRFELDHEEMNSAALIAYAPDGKAIYSTDFRGDTITQLDMWTGSCTGEYPGLDSSISRLVLSPDGALLAAVDSDTVKLWDVGANKLRGTLSRQRSVGHGVGPVAFSPDGKSLAIGVGAIDSRAAGGEVEIWDLASLQLRTCIGNHESIVSVLAFSPDGTTLAAVSYRQPVRLWDVTTGRLKMTLLAGAQSTIEALTFSPDGKLLAAGCWQRDPSNFDESLGEVQLWNPGTGIKLQTLATPRGISEVVFSPDGDLLAGVGCGDRVNLWRVNH